MALLAPLPVLQSDALESPSHTEQNQSNMSFGFMCWDELGAGRLTLQPATAESNMTQALRSTFIHSHKQHALEVKSSFGRSGLCFPLESTVPADCLC